MGQTSVSVGRGAMVRRLVSMVAVLSSLTGGCAFMRDPMDPRGTLDHRIVNAFVDAERITRGRQAFERARQRAGRVEAGMSQVDVEVAMRAIVVTEIRGSEEEEGPRKKFIDGLLCRVDPTPLRQRWLFGYDEGGVELVGFAIEFTRDNPEKERWTVRGVDGSPEDDCPEAEE